MGLGDFPDGRLKALSGDGLDQCEPRRGLGQSVASLSLRVFSCEAERLNCVILQSAHHGTGLLQNTVVDS